MNKVKIFCQAVLGESSWWNIVAFFLRDKCRLERERSTDGIGGVCGAVKFWKRGCFLSVSFFITT